MPPKLLPAAPLLLAASLALGACGSGATDTKVATGVSTTQAPATTAASATAGSTPAGAVTKVSANDASAAEITAALTAAGVPNADAWTDEVMEYRPYPTDAADLPKLREELAKYNPPAGLIDQIVSALTP